MVILTHVILSPARGSYRSRMSFQVGVPRLNGGRMGMLATRSPHRPCPIGAGCQTVVTLSHNLVCLDTANAADACPANAATVSSAVILTTAAPQHLLVHGWIKLRFPMSCKE